jgi:hypothetical protein
MKKKNKGVMTRKGYKVKKKVDKAIIKVKKAALLMFIGFILGLLYSNIFIQSNLIAKAQTNKNDTDIQIDQETKNLPINENKAEISEDKELYTVKCELDEVSCKIKELADNYEVDWKLAVAISKHETKNYTSFNFKEKNNVGGLWNGVKGEFYRYATLDEGIDAYISNLRYNYIDIGLTTIEAIQTKYAPIGALNDPNNMNADWIPGVTRYYKELAGK